MRLTPLALVVSALALLVAPAVAEASPSIRYGIQDDAWLLAGPGTLDSRLDRLDRLGTEVVRFTIRWESVAAKKPAKARDNEDPAYRWGVLDELIKGLRTRGIRPVITLYGTPKWANRGRAPNWAPTSNATFAAFAYAAANRYGRWVDHWLVWNEPNKAGFFRPTTPKAYVALLNAAYPAIKAGDPTAAFVGGGVTGPRGGAGGVSPVDWIRGMRSYRAKLDAYAHHPYPIDRVQTPSTGGCGHCETITMATLPRLLREVQRAWGGKRVWLTEYGYQTNPPDRYLGVSYARQARYLAEAAYRAYAAPRVDMLIQFLYRDDSLASGWQSGLFTRGGKAKPSYQAFRMPVAVVSRAGTRAVLWGHVRGGTGRQAYRLQARIGGKWRWLGGVRRTNARGFFRITVRLPKGAQVRAWSARTNAYGATLALR